MIIKLILDGLFELDLSNYEFRFIEQNNWIENNTIAKYTFPVEINLTKEQNIFFNNITDINAIVSDTKMSASFFVFGKEHQAVFIIERALGKKIVGQILYGLEEFPNFGKPLSALPLQKIQFTGSIYNHAKNIITQNYPNVNYNFPQVFTDALDTDTDQWRFFEGIINNYVNLDFLQNEFDINTNEQINRNVMQPLPYLLHVLKVGLQDAGYILAGDILTDPYYNKTLLYALNDYYINSTAQNFELLTLQNQYHSLLETKVKNGYRAKYINYINFPEPGRYKIAGNIIITQKLTRYSTGGSGQAATSYTEFGTLQINYKNTQIKSQRILGDNINYFSKHYISIDLNIDYTGSEGDLEIITIQHLESLTETGIVNDLTITQIAKFDNNLQILPTLNNVDKIDLTKSVPNITFGKFFESVLALRNYGYTIQDNTVRVDKKEIKLLDYNSAVDLSSFEVKSPERIFKQDKSYLIKTFDFDHENYKPEEIFIDTTGYKTNFIKKETTEETTIDAMYLPIKTFGVSTAHGFLDDNTKVQMVLYSGLINSINVTEDSKKLSLLNNFIERHQEWYNFILNSISFNWNFLTTWEATFNLNVKSVIYAYKQFHLIKRIERATNYSQRKGLQIEIEIETESLE